MIKWIYWSLVLAGFSVLVPFAAGELAVLTRLFKEDPDTVKRSPLPDEDKASVFEAPSPEPR
jgi:hypothetical protein